MADIQPATKSVKSTERERKGVEKRNIDIPATKDGVKNDKKIGALHEREERMKKSENKMELNMKNRLCKKNV